jgi:hypothetical protein
MLGVVHRDAVHVREHGLRLLVGGWADIVHPF